MDHGDEGGSVSVSASPCPGGLEEIVQALHAGVAIGWRPALKNAFEVLFEGWEGRPYRLQPGFLADALTGMSD